MDDKQIARANDLISGMREQRDLANNKIVELVADLLDARREIERLGKEMARLKTSDEDEPELPLVASDSTTTNGATANNRH